MTYLISVFSVYTKLETVSIGAGSVVTKDIPDWSIAAGNPCKVIRKITDDDKKLYFKNREFDEESWNHVEEILSKNK